MREREREKRRRKRMRVRNFAAVPSKTTATINLGDVYPIAVRISLAKEKKPAPKQAKNHFFEENYVIRARKHAKKFWHSQVACTYVQMRAEND